MIVPNNPLVMRALNTSDEKGSISWKIKRAAKLSVELNRLERLFETESNPSEYLVDKLKSTVEKLEPLLADIKEWEKNCTYKVERLY